MNKSSIPLTWMDLEFLPSKRTYHEKIQQILWDLDTYFHQGLEIFNCNKPLEMVHIYAHRVFYLCVQNHPNTKEIVGRRETLANIYLPWSTQKLDTSVIILHITRKNNTKIKFVLHIHDNIDYPIGYVWYNRDTYKYNYTSIDDEIFQLRWSALIKTILQIGLLNFLSDNALSITSKKTVLRNILRLSDDNQNDLAEAIQKIIQSQTPQANLQLS